MEFSRPQGALSADTTLWLYTSLSSGSSTIVTATSRLETILKANRVPFKALDVATEEKARMLWGRRAGERKLPGLVKQGMVLADLPEVEEWNEYGEVRENLLDEDEAGASPALVSLSKPAVAATPPPRPEAPTPLSATTHNAVTGAPATTPSAAAIKSAASISSLKSTATAASVQSGKSAESERKENMLSLAEQVAAKAKKASSLRTASGSVLGRNKADSSASKATTSTTAEESKEKSEDVGSSATESAKTEDTEIVEAIKSTDCTVPITEQAKDASAAVVAIGDEVKVTASKPVTSNDKPANAAEKAESKEDDEDEDSEEDGASGEEGGGKTRKTQEQDPLAIENGMMALEIQMMLNSPTMGSVRARRKRSDGGKPGENPDSPETVNSNLEDDDDIPGFHSPANRSGGASPLSSMSPMSGFGFLDADDHPASKEKRLSNINESNSTTDDTQSHAIPVAESGPSHGGPLTSNVPELKNQRSMVTTEGSSTLEKPIIRMPSLPDDEEEVSAGCCGGLFGGGKKKKKKTS